KGTTERLFRPRPDIPAILANSPIGIAYQGGGPVRCGLSAPPQEGEFAILGDLRRDGYTDYAVYGVPFADGSHKALSLATRRPGGFEADELKLFEAMISAVAFNLEVQALRRTARTLLDTYVGQQSGGRVLEGQIQRGSGETIRAVIWLCDLRGFTSLSERLPRDELIDLLNSYFGPMCDAVAKDGGDVMYGNIGSDTRLDFTVIGPAVNLTARIESMCRELGRQLLLSADFVAAGNIKAQSLGAFALKGVGADQEIFAPTPKSS